MNLKSGLPSMISTQHRANLAKYSLLIPTVLVISHITLKKNDMSGIDEVAKVADYVASSFVR